MSAKLPTATPAMPDDTLPPWVRALLAPAPGATLLDIDLSSAAGAGRYTAACRGAPLFSRHISRAVNANVDAAVLCGEETSGGKAAGTGEMSLQGAASMAVLAETMRDLVGGKRLARIEIAYKAGVPVPAWVRCTGRVTALRGAEIDTEAAIVDPATWTPLVTAKATWDSQRTRGIRESVPEHIAAVVSRGHKSPALIEAVGRLVAQPTFGGNGMDNMRHWKHTVFAGPCDVYCEVDRETLPIALYLMADTSACFNGWADAQHHMVFTGTLSFEFEPVVISSGWVHFVSRRIKDESRKMAVEFEAETGCGVRLGRGQGVMVKVGRLKL